MDEKAHGQQIGGAAWAEASRDKFGENVPGLQSVDDTRGPLAKFLKLLTKLGYWHCHKVIYACHYGVPQRRQRLVLVASRLGPISFPKPTHGPGAKMALPTVWEAMSDAVAAVRGLSINA